MIEVLENVEETELTTEVTTAEKEANSIMIRNDYEYEKASEMAKAVKGMQKKVTEYWEPVRKSTYEAYNTVNKRKKEMLDPLARAEKVIKSKMGEYLAEQERIRKEKEEELRRIAMQEAEAKMREAEQLEATGDLFSAEMIRNEAGITQRMADTISVAGESSKVKGVSKLRGYRILSIDESAVPVMVGGICVRPVDEKAIMRAIKLSDGNIRIPGVVFEEAVDVRIRA